MRIVTLRRIISARDCVKDAEQHLDDGEFVNVKEITIAKLFEKCAQFDDDWTLKQYYWRMMNKSIEEGTE